MYLSAHQATKKLGISSDTLRRWLKQGKITAKTSPSGNCPYNISSIFSELTSTTKKGFLYARVAKRGP